MPAVASSSATRTPASSAPSASWQGAEGWGDAGGTRERQAAGFDKRAHAPSCQHRFVRVPAHAHPAARRHAAAALTLAPAGPSNGTVSARCARRASTMARQAAGGGGRGSARPGGVAARHSASSGSSTSAALTAAWDQW